MSKSEAEADTGETYTNSCAEQLCVSS